MAVLLFDEFVRIRGQALIRLAFLLSGDPHHAEDLAQSTLAKAYRAWERVSAMEHPDAYVKKMLVREHTTWARRASSSELPTESALELSDEQVSKDPAVALTESDAMWRLLATLPTQQRTALVLRYYLDMSDEQIANMVGRSSGTVRSNASRGLAALRRSSTPTMEHMT